MSIKKCAEIQEHLNNYLKEEKALQAQLQKRKTEQEQKLPIACQRSSGVLRKSHISNEDATIRNQQLIKELEISRARLRTLTSFTPTDYELRERAEIYRRSLSQIQ